MINLKKYISELNTKSELALSIFLTAGYPDKKDFIKIAELVYENGADLMEIGFPFSDPLADGTVIQQSSLEALRSGFILNDLFRYGEQLKLKYNKPLIGMGYANSIVNYGNAEFFRDALNAGFDALIVPDIPYDEYEDFYADNIPNLPVINLVTPTSTDKRIKEIDTVTDSFIYYVSVKGTTGFRRNVNQQTLDDMKRVRSMISKNKMLTGFGISSIEDISTVSPYCDGIIIGSAVIKKIMENQDEYESLSYYIRELKSATTKRHPQNID